MKRLHIYIALLLIVIPILYCSNTKRSDISTLDNATVDTTKVYTTVERMPVFPGGEREFQMYMSKNLVYPDLTHICGNDFECMLFNTRTTVRFVVSRTGRITEATALKNEGGALSDSLIKVVQSMPDWTPGTINGVPVNVYFTIPMHLDFRMR